MSPTQVRHFIDHYERLTRHMMDELPGRADLMLKIDEQRCVVGLNERGNAPA